MKQMWWECLSKMFVAVFVFSLLQTLPATADTVTVGMNYPKTGPYSIQGLDQWRAAELAVEEINAAGGILGKQVKIINLSGGKNVFPFRRNRYWKKYSRRWNYQLARK